MSQQDQQFCFCTLALGYRYRQLAALLAQDMEKYAKWTKLVVLTDQPQDFHNYPQVLAFEHRIQGVKCYHDKRFAIAKSLSLFDACIFLDADMRILAKVPEEITWLSLPGITTRTCKTMPERYVKVTEGNATKEFARQFSLVKKATAALNLTAEWENIKFVHEFLFSVSKDSGKEDEFLRQWGNLANYFELNGLHDAEGNAIGLAAAKAGMAVRWSEMPGISFFKDRTEIIRIEKGQSKIEEMSKYFKEHDKIAHSHKSWVNKALEKLNQKIQLSYRKIRLKIVNLGFMGVKNHLKH